MISKRDCFGCTRNDNPHMKQYWKLFLQLANMSFGTATSSQFDFWSFIIGKMIRMLVWLALIFSLFQFTNSIAGFSKGQMILLYTTMNLIDVVVQVLFYRGFQALQHEVRKGNFDFVLTKPVNPVMLVAFRYVDLMDIVTLPFSIAVLVYGISLVGSVSLMHVFWYVLLVMNGLVIILGLCLIFGGLTFYTTQMENIWWFYRYGMQVARFPIDIYSGFFKVFFTYVLPMAFIVTFPAKAYFGVLSLPFYVYSFAISIILVTFGLWFWNHAVARYQSASS